jgi:hypothetical protein
MRDADLSLSRRNFLLTTAKAAGIATTGLIVGPAVFEWLDRMAPRRLLVNGWGPERSAFDIYYAITSHIVAVVDNSSGQRIRTWPRYENDIPSNVMLVSHILTVDSNGLNGLCGARLLPRGSELQV